MIAALYVRYGGPYYFDSRIDPWDITRDARRYNGPFPVIAHPPCAQWSKLSPFAKQDTKDCFGYALESVRKWGGVLEHPEHSKAWGYYRLTKPSSEPSWQKADEFGGITCLVFQSAYGHKACKPTWLYACKVKPLDLLWEPGVSARPIVNLSNHQRLDTPYLFKEALIALVSATLD